jgi:mRNA interferase MazF
MGSRRERWAEVVVRGEIYLVELDPVVGSESNETRPALVVSSNAVNDSAARRGRGIVTVIPITRNLTHVFPFQVLLPKGDSGLALDSKAQAEQVRSLSTERFVRQLGTVSVTKLREVDDALRLHLGL